MSNSLTLYDIERGLAEALAARDEAKTPEELSAAELALSVYADQELKKADGYINTIKAMEAAVEYRKAERDRHGLAAKRIQSSADWLKQHALAVMQEWGVRRIEGRTAGTLLVRANGGPQPLIVQDEILPSEYKLVTITLPQSEWNHILGDTSWDIHFRQNGVVADNGEIRRCLDAGGDVPGAHYGERGESLQVK